MSRLGDAKVTPSALRCWSSVTLTGGLSRSPEHGSDGSPGLPVISGGVDRVRQILLAGSSALECQPHLAQGAGVTDIGDFGLVLLETLGQIVRLAQNLLCSSWHRLHLK